MQAPRLQFERRLRLCDPEVAVNSSWELTVGSSSKEKTTVTKGRRGDTGAAGRHPCPHVTTPRNCGIKQS